MKKVLYIFDDINYESGAKKVMVFQMKQLAKMYDVYLLTLTPPNYKLDFLDSNHIYGKEIWSSTVLYMTALRKVVADPNYTFIEKIKRCLYSMSIRLGLEQIFITGSICRKIEKICMQFDDVIVVSEASKVRKTVSGLNGPKKIQWIHTDYSRWSQFSEWSRAITKNDKLLYRNYDSVVVLSNYCKMGLNHLLPEIANKTVVIPNMIDGDNVIEKAQMNSNIKYHTEGIKFITVARIDKEKRIDIILEIAETMKKKGIRFEWMIVGDGPEKEKLEFKKAQKKLDEIIFCGYQENPYSIMRKSDVLVLTSQYEGTPVTIDEAMVLGLHIIAPDVGGIREQVNGYTNVSLIINNDYSVMYNLSSMKNKVQINYVDRNQIALKKLECIL